MGRDTARPGPVNRPLTLDMSRIVATLGIFALTLCGCAMKPTGFDAVTRLPVEARGEYERQLIVTLTEVAPSLATPAGASPKAYGYTSRYEPSPYTRRISNQIADEYGLTWVAEWRINVLNVHCIVFRARDVTARSDAMRRLMSDPRVESVQPMHRFRTTAETPVYNDPYLSLQRHVETLRVADAHRWSQGRGVRIAVIDTGADLNHPELAGRVPIARNFVDNDQATFFSDAHGTAVVGVIGAATNNGHGIVGVAPQVDILALKACWHSAPDESATCNTLTLAEALAFALDRRAAVINMSLAGPEDPLLRRLVELALARGTIVVGPSTEVNSDANSFPASIAGVLAVADADGLGPLVSAQLAAPGREILTLAPFGRYDFLSGVSLSSAMVSGVVALLLERNHALTPANVRALLEKTASAVSVRDESRRVVNACDAVASVVHQTGCAAPDPARKNRAAARSTAPGSAGHSGESRRKSGPQRETARTRRE